MGINLTVSSLLSQGTVTIGCKIYIIAECVNQSIGEYTTRQSKNCLEQFCYNF